MEEAQQISQSHLSQAEKLAVIEKANDANVLMRILCTTMGLSTKITHIQFVETFSKLQKDSFEYQKELQEKFTEGLKAQAKLVTPEGELTPAGEIVAAHVAQS